MNFYHAINRAFPKRKRQILRIMKITAFLLLISFLTVSAGTFAQKITLKAQRASLEKVLDQIRQQSGIDIVYSNDVISKSGPVNIDVKNATVEEALKNCLKDQPLTFDIEDGTVVIKAKEESLLDKAKALFAQVTVTGKVIDENGFPMAGVTVKQKGTTNATATDVKGTFSLTVPDNSTIITLTFVGYEPKELISKDIKGATITLVAAPQSLHEVQIFKGYYSQKEEENTGDVTVVHADVLEQQPVDNPIVALEGRVPGMVITQTSGVAGSGITVQIRGQSSLSQGTNPLYVVDGVPYSSTMLQSIGYNILGGSSAGGTVGSPLNFIDPKDIESIEVLKDADATSIYGSRGANGVILITTKKGKVGAAKADVRYEEGFGQVGHFLNLLNTQQYLQVRREAFKNDGVTIPSSPTSGYDINGTWDTTRYTNWQKVLIGGTSHYTDAHGTVSGGTENIQYNIIGGYHRETTVFPGDFADQKISVLANLSTSSANKRFKTSLSVSYLNDNNNLNQTDLTSFITYDPDAPPPYNANGTLNWGPSNDFSNPFQYTYKTYKVTTNNLIAHSHISYTIIPGLEISTSLGYTNMQGNESTASPFGFQLNKTGNNSTLTGSASFINNSVQSWDVDPQISYQAKLGPGKISALLGSTITDNSTNGQWLNGSGYSSDVLLGSLLGAVSITAGPITNSEYRYNALLARIGYAAYDGKYVLNLTANRDGSSRFGPGRQFANFGSVGMAWNFYKEKYVQDAFPFLSFGKLRGSYGTTGNDQIGDYQYLDLYNIISSTVPYQGAQSLQNTTLYNPDLEWEIDRKLEGGLELGFLKDRLLLSISYFRNRSSNQLVGEQLPSITGNGSITANLPATVQNTGLELELNTTNIKKGDFSWSTNFNLTIPKNELLSFPGQASSTFHNLIIGQPITSLHVFQYAGVNPTTGLYQFQTANGTLTSTPNPSTDLLASVNLAPKFYGGFGNTFTYKSLRLDFFFTFTKQEAPNPLFALSSAEPGYKNVNLLAGVLNRWQSPGQTGVAVEQFSQSFGNAYTAYANVGQSTYDYVDGSYIRLKNLSLSYNLPNIWKQKLGIQSWNVFLLGQNLFTLTKYQGLDPETRSMTSLPTLRVITVGLQIGF